jgi:hypothetical protein
MLPSPSLGPPLLSASWSPPLPCGMGFAGWAGAVAGGAGGVLACSARFEERSLLFAIDSLLVAAV